MYKRVQFPEDAVFLYLDRTLEAKAPSRPFPQGSPSASSKTRLGFLGPRAASPSSSLPRSTSIFPVSATPPEVRLLRPHIPGLCFQRNSTFLYSLLKSAASAVLKLMSAVIAIAHVLFVSMKLLSVSTMLLEYSFGKLKYDSTTLPYVRFLRFFACFMLLSFLFLLLFSIFLLSSFSVWVSPTPTPRTKISIGVPVDRIPVLSQD